MEKILRSVGTWILVVVLIAIGIYGRTFASDAVTIGIIVLFGAIWLIYKFIWSVETNSESKTEKRNS
jgi:threonine/homoserine/homoserine lactone efflux protein